MKQEIKRIGLLLAGLAVGLALFSAWLLAWGYFGLPFPGRYGLESHGYEKEDRWTGQNWNWEGGRWKEGLREGPPRGDYEPRG